MMEKLQEILTSTKGITHHHWPILQHEIPVITISGTSDGPTLMISGLLHQDELIGPAVFDKLLNGQFNPKPLKGNIVILPIVSTYQVGLWRGFEYFHDAASATEREKLKGGKKIVNANRFFPGKPEGEWMEKFSYEITENFIKNADVVLDFHNCRLIDGCFAACSNSHEESIALANSMGMDFIDLQNDSSMFSQTMYLQASKINKTALLLEFPGYQEQSCESSTDRAYNSLLNAMKFLKMIPGELKPQPSTFFKREEKAESIISEDYGHFSSRVKNGQTCQKGDILGVLRNLNDFTISKKFIAPFSGACASIGPSNGYSIIKPGDEIATYKKYYTLNEVLK
ncbi:MAG: hypothetical protein COA79_08255 [Planctomycetota bacterium]|nr:MAG: hypothetical protein COA79_08255 [Planctomycetota bacterium]